MEYASCDGPGKAWGQGQPAIGRSTHTRRWDRTRLTRPLASSSGSGRAPSGLFGDDLTRAQGQTGGRCAGAPETRRGAWLSRLALLPAAGFSRGWGASACATRSAAGSTRSWACRSPPSAPCPGTSAGTCRGPACRSRRSRTHLRGERAVEAPPPGRSARGDKVEGHRRGRVGSSGSKDCFREQFWILLTAQLLLNGERRGHF